MFPGTRYPSLLVAAQGQEALRIGEQYEGPLHLLVTDVVMPDLGGRDLADIYSMVQG